MRLLLPVAAFVLALGSSACSQAISGTPTSAAGTSTTKSASAPPSTTKSSRKPGPGIEPCALLTPDEVTSVGASGSGNETRTSAVLVCDWRVDKGRAGDGYTIGLAVFSTVGLRDVIAKGPIERLTVGSHEAAQSMRPSGSGCVISIGVTAKSRVDIAIAGGGDHPTKCARALEVAKLVEPKLPA